VNKGGYSSNCKIVPVEFLHLMAKYTLPFSKPEIGSQQKFYIFSEKSHEGKILPAVNNNNFLSPIQSWSANFQKNCKPIQSWSGKNSLQSWSSPIQSWSVLISGSSLLPSSDYDWTWTEYKKFTVGSGS